MNKLLFDRFNSEDTSLVISGYPERSGLGNNYGISWYTKETITPIAKKKNARFIVLAETNHNNDPKIYQEGRILVLRVFDQRHLSLYPQILKWLNKFNKVKNVYVHSEFGANGGVKNFAFLIPFLMLIKASGRRITFFAHNFVESFDSIATHLNFKKNSLRLKVFNTLLKFYNRGLGIVVDKVIVMDETLAKRAQRYVPKSKIISIPIFVNAPKNTISRTKARMELGIKEGEKVLLYFGFVTWYKGADWIINKVKNIKNKGIKLILAGGPAYSLKDKKYYLEYYQKQLGIAAKEKNITLTGFIPEADIEKYFKASDLIVFPYRGLIGSSGSLSYALTYKKPFMLSSHLTGILENSDCVSTLKELDFDKNKVLFDLNKSGFEKIVKTVHNKRELNKLTKFSKTLSKLRSKEAWTDRYFELIFKQDSLFESVKRKVAYVFTKIKTVPTTR